MMLDPRRERIVRNEVRFRDINERLEAGLRRVQHAGDLHEFVCECGRRECEQLISLTFDEYEAVRGDSRHFVVVPGHVIPDTEHVVTHSDRYDVVEKEGEAIDVADATDGRGSGEQGVRRA